MAYEAAIYGHKGESPAFYQKAMEDAIKAHPRPTRGGTGATSPAATGPGPGLTVTDDEARAAAAYVKAHPEVIH